MGRDGQSERRHRVPAWPGLAPWLDTAITDPCSQTCRQGSLLITLSGDLDLRCADQVATQLTGQPDQAVTSMVIDLCRVTFLSSAGLRAVTDVLDRARWLGLPCELVVTTGPVLRLLELVGTTHRYSVRGDRVRGNWVRGDRTDAAPVVSALHDRARSWQHTA